jgi:hypothetical protein
MERDQVLGKFLFDSNPNNFRLILIGLIFILIGIPIIIFGFIYESVIIFSSGLMIVTFGSSYFFGSASSNEHFRFKIYQKGIIINVARSSKDPRKMPLGERRVGKRIVKYETIHAIHPIAFRRGKRKYFDSIGLQIILPKEQNNFMVGIILLTGTKITTMPEVINLLKSQMDSIWEDKYKKDEQPTGTYGIKSSGIPLLIDSGKELKWE